VAGKAVAEGISLSPAVQSTMHPFRYTVIQGYYSLLKLLIQVLKQAKLSYIFVLASYIYIMVSEVTIAVHFDGGLFLFVHGLNIVAGCKTYSGAW
jgi:hypothetical protein